MEIKVNLDLFDASRPAEGNFKKKELEDSRDELLFTIADWFHDLYESASQTPWLSKFAKQFWFSKCRDRVL